MDNRAELEGKSKSELKDISAGLGVTLDGNESKADLVSKILVATGEEAEAPEDGQGNLVVKSGDPDGDKNVVQSVPGTERSPAPEYPVPQPVDVETESKDAATEAEVRKALKPFTDAGLGIEFTGSTFTMRASGKEDSGTLNQPIDNIVNCARKLVRVDVQREQYGQG